jgi:signal transduction histidine kinase/ligand-binding sensor domain-containing protein
MAVQRASFFVDAWSVALGMLVMCAAAASDARAASMIDRTGRFAIQWWTADDGLPDGPLRGVAFAADGSLYCAGSRQLVRFDGVAFAPLPPALVDPLHDAIGDFWALAVDREGRLWVRGVRAVARLEGPEAGTRFTVLILPAARITNMAFAQDGSPIFIGEGVVLGCDGGEVGPFPTATDDEALWRYGGIDPASGTLWLWGDVEGIRRLYHGRVPARPGEPLVVERLDDDVAARVITVGFGQSGPMALLPDSVALRRDDGWERLPPMLPDADFRVSGKILESNDGTVWISSHNGLLACRSGGIETAIEGLPGFSSFTYQLVADREGGVWAACTGGLLAVRRTALHVRPLADCRATFERADGSVLVGTPGAVMLVPAAAAADAAPGRIATLPKDAIPTALCADDAGRIWVGTQDSFLLRVADGQVVQMTKPDRHFRELRSIQGIVRDTTGRIWVGTGNGLAVHDAKTDTMQIVSAHDAPFQAVVVGLAADTDGGILAATLGNGIERHAPDGTVTRVIAAADLPGRKSIVMRRDSQGTLWVGGDRGLVRVAADGTLTRLSTALGLVSDAVRQIEEDGRGRLWLALREGHLQGIKLGELANLAAGRVGIVRGVVFGPLDGLGENECVGHAMRASPGAGLVIPLSRGLLEFDPTAVSRVTVESGRPQVERLVAPRYAFRFDSPGIHWGAAPLFQTRLVGVDAGWSMPTTVGRRDYASLPAGKHRFEVRAVAGETDREFPTTAIEVDVPVPWYRTGWALTGLSLGVGGLAAWVSRELTRLRARRRIAALERQQDMERERARIARDIHDSLGAGLTRMALMSDLARKASGAPEPVRDRLDAIYKNARGLARSVDEIVWAVNPRNDTVSQFVSYVVNDVEEFVRAGDLTLRLEVPDGLPDDRPLSTQVRHHVCLAVREILQNVLRHAQATHVDFTILVSDITLSVIVHDDGVGFERDQKLAAEQDGLENLRARVAEIDGRVVFESRPGSGTRVTLTVPLDPAEHVEVPAIRIFNGKASHAS